MEMRQVSAAGGKAPAAEEAHGGANAESFAVEEDSEEFAKFAQCG